MKISLHSRQHGSGASDVAFAASELGRKLLALQNGGSASHRAQGRQEQEQGQELGQQRGQQRAPVEWIDAFECSFEDV
jgi:hypothetical protein